MASPALLIALVLVAGVVVQVRRALGPVTRERVEKFARRQQLPITPGNGGLVITYLAVTRRWRVTGLLVSVVVSVAWGLGDGHASIALVPLLSGWFAGAVIAEWRIGHLRNSGPRTASLVPRTATAYVGRVARALPACCAAIAVLVLVVAATIPASRHAAPLRPIGLLAAIAVLLAALARMVEQRVLDRPQPLDAADVVAADDAIRSRSLHVVVGASAALALFCVAQQCQVSADSLADGHGGGLRTLSVVVWLAGILCGRAVALTPWRVRRDVPTPVPLA